MLVLATSAFMAVGAYISALVCMNLGLHPFLSLPLAMAGSGAVAAIVGFATAKLPVASLIMGTLAFRTIIQVIINNWIDVTRGPMGVNNIPAVTAPFLGITSNFTRQQFYYFAIILLVLVVIVVRNITTSPFGRAWRGMRDNVDLSLALGVNQYRFDVIAFAVVGTLTGLAGGLYAHYIRTIDPTLAGFIYMSQFTTMVVAGGRGTVAGPLIGSLIYTILPELLRDVAELRQILYGLSIMLVIMCMPNGIAGLPGIVKDWWLKRRQYREHAALKSRQRAEL